jgi:hypothetical protein
VFDADPPTTRGEHQHDAGRDHGDAGANDGEAGRAGDRQTTTVVVTAALRERWTYGGAM